MAEEIRKKEEDKSSENKQLSQSNKKATSQLIKFTVVSDNVSKRVLSSAFGNHLKVFGYSATFTLRATGLHLYVGTSTRFLFEKLDEPKGTTRPGYSARFCLVSDGQGILCFVGAYVTDWATKPSASGRRRSDRYDADSVVGASVSNKQSLPFRFFLPLASKRDLDFRRG